MNEARAQDEAHESTSGRGRHVAVSGSTGMIGSALVKELRARGYRVSRLVRSRTADSVDEITWDPPAGTIDAGSLAGIDSAVNLAGENIGERWTSAQKARIRDSRVRGTRLLAETLASLDPRPRTFIAPSATGYYGDRGDELLDESSGMGEGFLASVVRDWEAAAQPARDAGIRVVNPRMAVVLNPEGGMLEKLLTPFRLGAGGKVGDGQQWLSWTSLTDTVRALIFLLEHEELEGVVNIAAPEPQRNEDFSHILGHVLHRPSLATVPAMAVRFMYGAEMANETVLTSQRVLARRLVDAGFTFRHPTLESALRHELGEEES